MRFDETVNKDDEDDTEDLLSIFGSRNLIAMPEEAIVAANNVDARGQGLLVQEMLVI